MTSIAPQSIPSDETEAIEAGARAFVRPMGAPPLPPTDAALVAAALAACVVCHQASDSTRVRVLHTRGRNQFASPCCDDCAERIGTGTHPRYERCVEAAPTPEALALRLAMLETRVREQSQTIADLREWIGNIAERCPL